MIQVTKEEADLIRKTFKDECITITMKGRSRRGRKLASSSTQVKTLLMEIRHTDYIPEVE